MHRGPGRCRFEWGSGMKASRGGLAVCAFVGALVVASAAAPAAAAPNGCSDGSPAYGVGISITPEFVGTDDVAIAAFAGELVDYDVTVFLRADPGGVIVCPIFGGTVTVTLPDGSGPFTIATGVALGIGQSVTFANVPAGNPYAVDEADAAPGSPRRVDAAATVAATSNGPDDGPQDDAPVTATAVAPTFLLAPSTLLTITPDRTVTAPGDAVTWTVVERNDTPAGYFPLSLTQPRVELSADGGATSFTTLTSTTAGFTGDNGDGALGTGEAWSWTVTTNPTQDTTITATGFGNGPRGRVFTFPGDPDERAIAALDVIGPSTAVGLSAASAQVAVGGQTTWTVTERNDGDIGLTSPLVHLDADGGDDGDIATLSSGASGDADGDGVLDAGETWTWTLTTVITGDTTVTATGHGIDPLGRDITFPLDPEERAAATVQVPPPGILPATGAGTGTTTIALAAFMLIIVGAGLRRASRARPRPS